MLKRILVIATTMFGLQAAASEFLIQSQLLDYRRLEKATMSQAEVRPMGLEDWVVGDTANYSFSMGFLSGTMVMKVREQVEEGFWVDQDIDAGFFGKQKVEMLVDKHTGRILKLIVNGKEEQLPEENNAEIEEVREEQVTVPAGTFDCVYVKLRDKSKDETSEVWINPSEVPVMGLLKQIAPTQLGQMVVELTSFEKL